MDSTTQNIVIIGAGAIGTAVGNILARKHEYNVQLLSIEEDVVESINNTRYNKKYFPNIKLSKFLKATADPVILKNMPFRLRLRSPREDKNVRYNLLPCGPH